MKVLETTLKATFIKELFSQAVHLNYAWLKFFFPSVEAMSSFSDIDLIVEEKEIIFWKNAIRKGTGVKCARFITKSYATYAEIFFEDNSYLEIDLINQVKRRDLYFMDVEEVLADATLNYEGIKVATLPHSFEYILLFYTLNETRIPEKYQTYFEELNKLDQQEIVDYISDKYDLKSLCYANLFECTAHRDKIIDILNIRPENQGVYSIGSYLKYIRDTFQRREPTITFSGVDGAGKSTILENAREMLEKKYRREVVVLRQRPSILPILSAYKYGKQAAESKAAKTLPRTGTNKSVISSLIRFLYYYVDYILGQWKIEWTYNRRGKMVLYDRYYFDFIADSKRANIILNHSFIRKLYQWVFKPELNIVLYADPEVILARKQELSHDDILDLTGKYLGMFEEFSAQYPQKYMGINNLDLDKTMGLIEAEYLKLAGTC